MAHGEVIAKYKLALHLKLLDAQGAVNDGVWVDSGQYERASFHVKALAAGNTVEVRGSDEPTKPADSTHGFIIGAAVTNAESEIVTETLPRWIKARVTVFASGTHSVWALLRGTK